MPIRKDQRARYPSKEEWRRIQERIRTRATDADGVVRCERCGKPEKELVRTTWDGTGRWAPKSATTNSWDPHWRDGYGREAAPPDPEKIALHYTEVVTAVIHLNHRPEDNGDDNLMNACQGCHLRHDRPVHQFWRRLTLRFLRRQPDQPALPYVTSPLALPASLEIGPEEEARLEAIGAQ